MSIGILLAAVASSAIPVLPAPSNGRIDCAKYDGTVLHFTDIEAIFRQVVELRKGEFEKSADFDRRVALKMSTSPSVAILRSSTERAYGYDPDQGMAAFDAKSFGLRDDTFYSAAVRDEGYLLKAFRKITGSFKGTTAFGAVRTVQKTLTTRWFIDDPVPFKSAWTINYDAKTAKSLLPFMKPAVVVVLSHPERRQHDEEFPATLTNPSDDLTSDRAVTGRVVCGLMYLSTGKVVATFDFERDWIQFAENVPETSLDAALKTAMTKFSFDGGRVFAAPQGKSFRLLFGPLEEPEEAPALAAKMVAVGLEAVPTTTAGDEPLRAVLFPH